MNKKKSDGVKRDIAIREFKKYMRDNLKVPTNGIKHEMLFDLYYAHLGKSTPRNKREIEKDLISTFCRIKTTKPKFETKVKKSVENLQYGDFYSSLEWTWVRKVPIKVYGRVCMRCGARGGEIHVDHIKPRSKYIELQLSPLNLQILCKNCNINKSDVNEIDYRTPEQIQAMKTYLATNK